MFVVSSTLVVFRTARAIVGDDDENDNDDGVENIPGPPIVKKPRPFLPLVAYGLQHILFFFFFLTFFFSLGKRDTQDKALTNRAFFKKIIRPQQLINKWDRLVDKKNIRGS